MLKKYRETVLIEVDSKVNYLLQQQSYYLSPQHMDLLRQLSREISQTIVDAIYTETEIEAKVEYTLLGDK